MPTVRRLLTGGSGRLGRELAPLLPGVLAPGREALELTDPASVRSAVLAARPEVVIHAAAYTDVRGAEGERARCWAVNVGGTRAVVAAAREAGARLVYVSTDYVFYGDRGGYREDDTPGPVRNTYALSKLAAEEVARTLPGTLVLRTSFRPRAWPYPTAFTDMFTSQDYVDVLAPELALAVRALERVPYDTLHIATERKSVYALARRRAPEVRPASRAEAGVELPHDISLDISRWQALRPRLLAHEGGA